MSELPDFVIPTNRVPVEPFITIREKAYDLIARLGNGSMFADLVAELYEIYFATDGCAYKDEPNPAYDEERANAFCATHPTNCGRRFVVGQSYTPDAHLA